MKRRYEVRGMSCGGCKRALLAALRRANIALDDADVSVEGAHVEVDAEQDPTELERAVSAAGFELGPPKGD